jgi:hypothetical protein
MPKGVVDLCARAAQSPASYRGTAKAADSETSTPTGCYCPDGVTAEIWRLALENFPAPRGKMVGPQGVCAP